ncbi:MAG: VCBS repeat-containing protein, partial [candidate division WOR-3 bacterium]
MRRTAVWRSGLFFGTSSGRVICWDCNHNGIPEVIFSTGNTNPDTPRRIEFWEYRPVNRYELVFADTGIHPNPPGIVSGNTRVYDVGDIDQDGLTDIVGANREVVETDDSTYNVMVVLESRDEHSFPDTVVWSVRVGYMQGGHAPAGISPDLDRDGRQEITTTSQSGWFNQTFWECVGDNQYERVWSLPVTNVYDPVYGDFDQDSLMDLAAGFYRESVYENVAPGLDSFVEVYRDSWGIANGVDGFTAQDLDGDGCPEALMSYFSGVRRTYTLCMWEATDNNTYERTLIDVVATNATDGGNDSRCGDLDGDGVEELVWALPVCLRMYKAVDDNQFQMVSEWEDDHPGEVLSTVITDMNGNGYGDLVVGGGWMTSVLEVEAVRVLHPDTTRELCAGETCLVRWEIFEPPRCDSISLFLLTDTVVPEGEWFCQRTGSLRFYHLDTIVTGLSPGDTTYPWIVPDTVLDAAWIVAIAYGPGWQFDCSDRRFSIVPSGVAERSRQAAPGPVPEPTIAGDVLVWSATAPSLRNVGDIALQSSAKLLDATGCVVMSLQPG